MKHTVTMKRVPSRKSCLNRVNKEASAGHLCYTYAHA
jgi:hypothetical protein